MTWTQIKSNSFIYRHFNIIFRSLPGGFIFFNVHIQSLPINMYRLHSIHVNLLVKEGHSFLCSSLAMVRWAYFTKWQAVLDQCLFTFLCSSLAKVRWAYFTKWQGVLDECLFTFLCSSLVMVRWAYFTKWQGVLDECLFTFLCSSLAMVRWAGTWSLLALRASLYHLSASSICPTFMYTSPAKKINECRLSELPDFIYLYGTGTVANIHKQIYIPSLTKLLQEKNAVILQI